MSADNWTECPRCIARKASEDSARLREAAALYGKVSAEEYEKAIREARIENAKALEETFREDYAIGVTNDGRFIVSYRGGCSKCGLTHEYKHKEPIKMEK